MRQDWIEFKGKAIGKVLVRPEYIIWISDDKDCEDDGYVAIHVDDGSREGSEFGVAEPYEQVKQKIMDAEKVDYNNVVVEHFTKEECELILKSIRTLDDGHLDHHGEMIAINIRDKLMQILKEEE